MPEMSGYEHGVPSWVDLSSPDLAASVRFYGELFGWVCQDQGEQAGHYTMALKGAKLVAALMPAQAPGQPASWSTYVNVDSADEVASKVEAGGGKLFVGPMDVMGAGRMAVFSDPMGAVIGIWEPREHKGAELVNEAGTLVWNELATSDLARARSFYSDVFGWGWSDSDEYREIQVAGRSVGGAMTRPEAMPAEVPDHWLVYFGSDDLDATLASAESLGASVLLPPTGIPNGRIAVVSDPQGAAFGLYQA